VSVLNELCSKRHWHPPRFELMEDVGPAHLKSFRFKVQFPKCCLCCYWQDTCNAYAGLDNSDDFEVFRPAGSTRSPIGVKFGMEESTKGRRGGCGISKTESFA